MPSSYSPLLRLTLPADGELVGTWGQVVNNGITALQETAIAGTAVITIADANTTLSVVNGAADEARAATLRCIGALTAQRDVICPATSKNYYVRNATTGGFGVRVKTAAGAGIVVPPSAAMLLYCDGTDVVEAVNMIANLAVGNIAILGDMVVAGNVTIDGTLDVDGSPFDPSGFVLKIGDTMTGPLTAPAFNGPLTGNVTGNVTGSLTGAASLNVLKIGDTMTGDLIAPNLTAGSAGAADAQITATTSGAGLGKLLANATGAAAAALVANFSGVPYLGVPTGAVGLGTIGSVPFVFTANNTEIARMATSGVFSYGGVEVGGRLLEPRYNNAAGPLVAADRGRSVILTGAGDVTVPAGVFTGGDVVTIYNTIGGSEDIVQGGGLTLRWAGVSDTGASRVLAHNGMCTIFFINSTVATISGVGLT